MYRRLHVLLHASLNAPFSTIPLGIFRIAYGLILLGVVFQLYAHKELIYDDVPFLKPAQLNIKLPLFFWLLNTLFLILGWLTRWVSVANFVFSLCLVYPLREFSYAFDTVMLSINAWMMIAPIGKRFSVDSTWRQAYQTHVPSFYSYLLLTTAVVWVYVDAGVQKLLSPLWREGIAFWRYASNPAISRLNSQWFLDNRWLCYAINYGVMVFQLSFPLLLFIKPLRWYLIFLGLSMHVGILIFFPIPLFSLTEIFLYLFLVPSSFWQKFDAPLSSSLVLPRWITPFFVFFQAYVCLFYLVIILQNPTLQKLLSPFLVLNKPLLGMVQHYLFIENLHGAERYTYSIVYSSQTNKSEFLPLITEEGVPHVRLYDRLWSQWDNVSHPRAFEEKNFRSHVARQIVFWLISTGKYHENHPYFFHVKRKRIVSPAEWREGLREEHQKSVWENYWSVKFLGNTFADLP